MDLQQAIKIAKVNYPFAKFLNYAYHVGKFYALVFTQEKLDGDIIGGRMIVVNQSTSKHDVVPVRPQTIEALQKKGKLVKVYSSALELLA